MRAFYDVERESQNGGELADNIAHEGVPVFGTARVELVEVIIEFINK